MSKLTAKQSIWLHEYLISLNATDAAMKAGYSKKTADRIGHENLKKLEQEVKQAMHKRESQLISKAEEVLQFLTSMMRGEIKEEVIVQENFKNKIMAKQASAKDRLKAAELLGKRHMLFTEKLHIEGEVKTVVVFEGEDEIRD